MHRMMEDTKACRDLSMTQILDYSLDILISQALEFLILQLGKISQAFGIVLDYSLEEISQALEFLDINFGYRRDNKRRYGTTDRHRETQLRIQ